MVNWPKPLVLLILDGFGCSIDNEYNAIAMANTPGWDQLQKDYLMTLINCSGSVVGLPDTFFLNGTVNTPNPGEDRFLVPSPKARTYDFQPEMSAPEVTEHLVNAITGGSLSDLAPTMLDILGVEKPIEMTGRSLLASV